MIAVIPLDIRYIINHLKKNFHWFQKYTVYPKWQLWVKIPILRIIGFADIRIIGHNTLFDFFFWRNSHIGHIIWPIRHGSCILEFIFTIQTVYFKKNFHKKHSKLERRSDDNPSVPICRWRKRYFDKKLFENTVFSTLSISFKIPKSPLKIGTFQNQKNWGGENGMVFPGGENGISPFLP